MPEHAEKWSEGQKANVLGGETRGDRTFTCRITMFLWRRLSCFPSSCGGSCSSRLCEEFCVQASTMYHVAGRALSVVLVRGE